MGKRVRSPNYPAISLPDAVQRVAMVYKNQHTHGAPREVIARSMGYNSLNGASATVISAATKYGLLEGRADDIKVSDRAMRILHPQSSEEKAEALKEAAREPVLFRELAERFPGPMPAEEVLRNYLIRSGFASGAVSAVILSYRETNEFVERESDVYDSGSLTVPAEASVMHATQHSTSRSDPQSDQKAHFIQGDERQIVQYQFEGGASLRIIVGGDIETEEALSMAETLIALKRKEIESRTRSRANAPDEATNESDEEDEHIA